MPKKARPTWSGSVPGGLAPEAWAFLHSLPDDRFLWPYDVEGTTAHVTALESAGVLKREEAAALRKELRRIKKHPELIEETDEDVHSSIERVLTERLGDVGAKVHAGRSRNDQVATALRLWAKDAITEVRVAVAGLVDQLASRAAEHATTIAPGYTHLQRAQPVTIGHWLCAHAWAFVRDLERLSAAAVAADVSPLGAGALATSTLGIDPTVAQENLGFASVFANSMDAVSDRDFLADGAYACALAMVHLSRLSEEIVLWSSSEFGFVKLPTRFATGSSMMPQKRNPDVAELARGSAGNAVGALTGLLATMKGLPLAYNRDLQTDKRQVRDVLTTTTSAFQTMTGLVAGMEFDVDRLRDAASDPSLLATDIAEDLVRGGAPFRKAYDEVGKKLRQKGADPVPRSAARASVEARGAPGGPSARSVRAQAQRLKRLVAAGGP